MLKRKVTKLLRYVRWVIPSSNAIPVHWHVGRPNFGDDINPALFKNLLGRQVMLSRDVNHERILGMGSILRRADKNCHVVGSGLLDPTEEVVGGVKSVVALRGELSARATGFSPEFLGDPAIFLPKYFRFCIVSSNCCPLSPYPVTLPCLVSRVPICRPLRTISSPVCPLPPYSHSSFRYLRLDCMTW